MCITFSSKNIHLIKDLELICLKLGYKSLGIKKGKTCYLLSLSTKSFLTIYNDIINISPLPILKKQKRLELGLKLLKKRYIHFDVKKEIINFLKIKPMTIPELCENIVARRNNIDDHLNKLRRENIVELSSKKAKEKGGAFIWKLSSQKKNH